MGLLYSLTLATALLPGLIQARWFNIPRGKPTAANDRCEFTLSSDKPFVCPAGQLEDGQIRLNGSYDTATFFISNGGIVDSDGFGCIVTDAPTTQFQCDHGKQPTPGFSIDSSNILLYRGSPSFWACPATDTEYNIYINPDFGQTKCFPVTLKASGCGASAPSPPSSQPVSTLWETATKVITSDVIQTVTVVETLSPTCAVPSSNSSIVASCKHCSTKSKSKSLSPTWTTSATTSSRTDTSTILPVNSTLSRRGLSASLHWHQFSRRALEQDWQAVLAATNGGSGDNGLNKWVLIGGTRFFPIDGNSAGLRVGTSTFYGCTVFVVVGTRGFYFGHLAEEGRGCKPLTSAEETIEQLVERMERSMDVTNNGWNAIAPADPTCGNDRWAIIMGSVTDTSMEKGPYALKDHFMDAAGVPPRNVFYNFYQRGKGQFEDLPGAEGKALVMVDDAGTDADGKKLLQLRVFMHNDQPRLVLRFTVDDGRLAAQGVQVSTSPDTTDGTKVYP